MNDESHLMETPRNGVVRPEAHFVPDRTGVSISVVPDMFFVFVFLFILFTEQR